MKLEDVLFLLKEDDKRITNTKIEIIKFFLTKKDFVTVNELRDMLVKKIDASTIYRNLEVLCQIGFLEKIEKDDKRWYRLKEISNKNKSYVECNVCGKRRVLDNSPAIVTSYNVDGYEITGYKFEFTGLCNDCNITDNNK